MRLLDLLAIAVTLHLSCAKSKVITADKKTPAMRSDSNNTSVMPMSSAICPCAYLEKGGFWSSNLAKSLGIRNGMYVEKRCSCSYDVNCEKRWTKSKKSLTLSWLGSYGVRESEIQLQFCTEVASPKTPWCMENQVSYTLRQLGLWVDLYHFNCWCSEYKDGSIDRFRYARSVTADAVFTGEFVDITCTPKDQCVGNQSCYREMLDLSGKMSGGRVLCSCPAGFYCPIYHINQSVRVPVNDSTNTIIAYDLKCRPEPKKYGTRYMRV